MIKRAVIADKVEYRGGKRVQTRTIREEFDLSDDFANLANVYQNIAARQSSIESLREDSERHPENKPGNNAETQRLIEELNVLASEINKYSEYIKAYEKGDTDEQ